MPLVTIDDLNQCDRNERAQLMQLAMSLQRRWDHWRKSYDDPYDLNVEFKAGKGRAPGVHASEVAGCARRLGYTIVGMETKTNKNVNMQRRFDVGTMMHAYIQRDFQELAKHHGDFTFEPEVRIHPGLGGIAAEWHIHSACDGVFTFYNGGAERRPVLRIGLEIKTMSEGEYTKANEPKADHKVQGSVYMKALDLPFMWYLYYNKSNSYTTGPEAPFLAQFDSQLWHTISSKVEMVRSMLSEGNIPEREEGMPCSWCPYTWHCDPEYMKRKERR